MDIISDYTLWRLEAPLGRTIGDNNCHYDTIGIVALRLRAADGRVAWGYGESCWKGVFTRPAWYIKPMADESAQRAVFERDWWPLLQGTSAPGLDDVRTSHNSALSYLDAAVRLALWDLKAQAQELPLFRLLGGKGASNRVRAYGSILDFPLSDEEAVKLARGFVARGFDAIKVKVGAAEVERDVARLLAIRRAVGPEIEITADANEAWSCNQAVERLSAYQSAGISLGYIEDPLPHDDVAGFAELGTSSPVPIVAHDYIHTPGEVDAFLATGVLRSLRVGKDVDFAISSAAAARRHDVSLIFGNSLLESNVHLALALPEVDRLEFSDLAWNDLVKEPVCFEAGYAVGPERPGHGLAPNMDVLNQWNRPDEGDS